MAGENQSKINYLLSNWPNGTVAVIPWLTTLGVYQQLAYEYERAGWLKRVGRGAYARAGDNVTWSGGVHAFQSQLGLKIHVGGKSALDLKGFRHFVPAKDSGILYLFGTPPDKPPAWFLRHNWEKKISYKAPLLFGKSSSQGLTSHTFQSFDIQVSCPERAMLEVLYLVPTEQSAEEALLLMEGLGTLRPQMVQQLLESCCSVKVKRLFLALAERCNHRWLKSVSHSKIKLGKGKRVVVRGGVLDPKYQITLPKPEREET